MTRTNDRLNTAADTAHLLVFQNYYEIEAVIPSNHHLVLDVPESVPVGRFGWRLFIRRLPYRQPKGSRNSC